MNRGQRKKYEQEAGAIHVRKCSVFLLGYPTLKMSVGIEAFVAITVRTLQMASRQNSSCIFQVRLHFFVYSVSIGINLTRIRALNKEQAATHITGSIRMRFRARYKVLRAMARSVMPGIKKTTMNEQFT
jgi:hypothetical protein